MNNIIDSHQFGLLSVSLQQKDERATGISYNRRAACLTEDYLRPVIEKVAQR